MTQRQELILKNLIKEYVKTAEPVGSRFLSDILQCSSATVRNEMAELERMGYLMQPHTSAGRVPTDAGYRYYVNLLMDGKELSLREQESLQADMLKLQSQYKKLARITAKLLSEYSDSMVMTGVRESEEFVSSGARKLLEKPEFSDSREVANVFEAVDRFEEMIDLYSKKAQNGEVAIQTYIGEENPMEEIKNCSLVVSEFKLPTGENGVIAVLGPKRMPYAHNISLVEYLTKLLSGGALVLFLGINLV